MDVRWFSSYARVFKHSMIRVLWMLIALLWWCSEELVDVIQQ